MGSRKWLLERKNRVRIQSEGRKAFKAGEPKGSHGYKPTTIEAHWWDEGWLLEWQLSQGEL